MDLQISVEHEINKAVEFVNRLRFESLAAATRMALNKTAKGVRTDLIGEFQRIRALKKKDFKSFLDVMNASGNDIGELEAKVSISGRSLKLIRFVRGKTEPANQRGVPVARRKALRVMIEPGKSKKRTDIFIIKGSGNRNIVVRRRGNQVTKTKNKMKYKGPLGGAESAPSLASSFEKNSGIKSAIQRLTIKRLEKEFLTALNHQIQKAMSAS